MIPKLRFPEFENNGEWEVEPLGKLSKPIVEKTKGRKFKLMSITSGVGLVSQMEKFGREIAGNSYSNYLVIQNEDFAYNKSSTKLYAEGEIAMYEDEELGAVPNSIFTCFRFNKDGVIPLFAKYPFANNIHGKWLRKFITVGARANGALQVNNKDLFSTPFPYPSVDEQQKIASCLSSLDDLIEAHIKNLDALNDHKKGLMQNLFPQKGEKVPKFRFPEFINNGEWKKKSFEKLFEIGNGRDYKHLGKGDIPVYGSGGYMLTVDDYLYDGESACIGRKGTINKPFFLTGKFWTVDTLFYTHSFRDCLPKFIYYIFQNINWLNHNEAGGVPSLSKTNIYNIETLMPDPDEQKRILDMLTGLDELINVQSDKIEQLKSHKKGLMQGLFAK